MNVSVLESFANMGKSIAYASPAASTSAWRAGETAVSKSVARSFANMGKSIRLQQGVASKGSALWAVMKSRGTLNLGIGGAVIGGVLGGMSDEGTWYGGALKGGLVGAAIPGGLYGAGLGARSLGRVLRPAGMSAVTAETKPLTAARFYTAKSFGTLGTALRGAGKNLSTINGLRSPGSIKGLGMIGAGHALGGAVLGAAGWGLAGLMRDGYEFDGVRQAGFWGAVGSGALIGGAAFGTKMGFRMAEPAAKSLVQGFNKMVGSARPVTQKSVFSTASSGLMKAVGKGAAVVGVNGAFMAAATAQGFRYTKPVNSAPPKRV